MRLSKSKINWIKECRYDDSLECVYVHCLGMPDREYYFSDPFDMGYSKISKYDDIPVCVWDYIGSHEKRIFIAENREIPRFGYTEYIYG